MTTIDVFLSHADVDKSIATLLKEKLRKFDFDVFLAHQDIEGGTKWMAELYGAIEKSDMFLILLSENYHNANFTDQEAGIALGNKKHVLPICIDSTEPYGFMSEIQFVKCRPSFEDSDIQKIVDLMLKITESGRLYNNAIIENLFRAEDFADSHAWASRLKEYSKFTDKQVNDIAYAYFENDQIYKSFLAFPIILKILYDNRKQFLPGYIKRLNF